MRKVVTGALPGMLGEVRGIGVEPDGNVLLSFRAEHAIVRVRTGAPR